MTTSSSNPFRNPELIAQHTNSSLNSSGPSATRSQTAPEQPTVSNSLMDAIQEDAPPAYTPMADTFQGEATMEVGPHRPFQHAPQPAIVHVPSPVPIMRPPVPQVSQPAVSVNQASVRAQSQTRSEFLPPPRHPSTARPSTVVSSSPSSGPVVPPRPPVQSFTQTPIQVQATTYLPPPGPPPHVRAQSYSPPPGPPPMPRPAPSARRVSVSGTSVGTSTMPDDGRPTTTPMPGHPLLRGGKLLVYPPGFECTKCHNTGYKNNDPSHSCSKCWDKYAKSYTGPLAYAPFPTSSSPSSTGGNNFQRPLPMFSPPQAHLQERHSRPRAVSPPKLQRRRSSPHLRHSSPHRRHSSPHRRHSSPHRRHSSPHRRHGSPHRKHGSPHRRHSPPRESHHHHPHHHPHHHQHQHHAAPLVHLPGPPHSHSSPPPHMYHPPPGAPVTHGPPLQVVYAQPGIALAPGQVAYPPGDPRIGGRLCWRCNGRGGISYLFFDRETCAVCSGLGRVFN